MRADVFLVDAGLAATRSQAQRLIAAGVQWRTTVLAPWIKVMDAMSDIRFATERISDMPVPNITSAPAFTAAGCPAWTYFCCGPRGRCQPAYGGLNLA